MNKKTLVTALQVAVTGGLLAWLFRDGKQNREMLTALSHANLLWIAGAFGVYGIVVLSAVTRWKVLLGVQGIHIAWTRLASLFMIGLLINIHRQGKPLVPRLAPALLRAQIQPRL